uniref:Uncharacterized protein n=1 Tax=Siphoviridae sp. ctHip2 TaxID=2827830 RepID=A0A8S5RWL4_9CAUD|nr:MAG TPA: hypothetical protein [Siphoviridae sp. ctHip2]
MLFAKNNTLFNKKRKSHFSVIFLFFNTLFG